MGHVVGASNCGIIDRTSERVIYTVEPMKKYLDPIVMETSASEGKVERCDFAG